MLRKARKTQDASSDDDAPEVVSQSTSKADVKRSQKTLRSFEAEERVRRKARNRDRDQKLKERARVTKGRKTEEKQKGVRFADQALEDDEDASEDKGSDTDDVEARMLRAMKDGANEVESAEEDSERRGDDSDEFEGLGQDMDLGDDTASGSDFSFAQDEDEDGMTFRGNDVTDPEAATDDEEMDEEEATPCQLDTHNSSKLNYLADDLFAAAFASQDLKLDPKRNTELIQQQRLKKRRRKSVASPKDLVIGGRTIRTLPRPSDPQSQATARSVPSARACKFVDQSLAMGGQKAVLRAKRKGWERRPANVGVMKYQGAPHGFVRTTR